MLIKSNKNAYISNLCLLFVCLFFSIIMAITLQSIDLFFSLFISILALWFLDFVAISKKILLNQDGCIIQLFCFKKFYKWKDIERAAFCDYSLCYPYDSLYKYGVEFLVNKKKRCMFLNPHHYSIYKPFSYFYVCFSPSVCKCEKKHIGKKDTRQLIFIVNQDEFMEKMNDWGVYIQRDTSCDTNRKLTFIDKICGLIYTFLIGCALFLTPYCILSLL